MALCQGAGRHAARSPATPRPWPSASRACSPGAPRADPGTTRDPPGVLSYSDLLLTTFQPLRTPEAGPSTHRNSTRPPAATPLPWKTRRARCGPQRIFQGDDVGRDPVPGRSRQRAGQRMAQGHRAPHETQRAIGTIPRLGAMGPLRGELARARHRALHRPVEPKTKTRSCSINNVYDPSTGYPNAQRAERLLGNAVLLTVASYGHPSYADPASAPTNGESATSCISSPRHRGRSVEHGPVPTRLLGATRHRRPVVRTPARSLSGPSRAGSQTADGRPGTRSRPSGRIVQMSPTGGFPVGKNAWVKAIRRPSGDHDGLKLVCRRRCA